MAKKKRRYKFSKPKSPHAGRTQVNFQNWNMGAANVTHSQEMENFRRMMDNIQHGEIRLEGTWDADIANWQEWMHQIIERGLRNFMADPTTPKDGAPIDLEVRPTLASTRVDRASEEGDYTVTAVWQMRNSWGTEPMLESEWNLNNHPARMLWFVTNFPRNAEYQVGTLITERQKRLFVAACALGKEVRRKLGDGGEKLLADAYTYVEKGGGDTFVGWAGNTYSGRVHRACQYWAARMQDQGDLTAATALRDIVGNPFQVNPFWRLVDRIHDSINFERITDWNSMTVESLASSIYEDFDFDSMPVLADCLEEAGCTDDRILSHCRNGLDHYRGCWVLDGILGKEVL